MLSSFLSIFSVSTARPLSSRTLALRSCIETELGCCTVAIAAASKAGFIARKVSTDKDLREVIEKAIAHDGFSIVEILELCTEHATKRNELKGNMLAKMAEAEGHKLGIIKNDVRRKEFSIKYATDIISHNSEIKPPEFIEPAAENNLTEPAGIIISGSAGERVQSSAALFCEAAVRCGLQATQKNDNPITQGSGFSLSEVIISPDEINYTGVDKADFVIITSEEGLKELVGQDMYNRSDNTTVFIIDNSISLSLDGLNIISLPLRKSCGGEKAALGAIDYLVKKYAPFSHEKFKKIIEKRNGEYGKIFKKEYYEIRP